MVVGPLLSYTYILSCRYIYIYIQYTGILSARVYYAHASAGLAVRSRSNSPVSARAHVCVLQQCITVIVIIIIIIIAVIVEYRTDETWRQHRAPPTPRRCRLVVVCGGDRRVGRGRENCPGRIGRKTKFRKTNRLAPHASTYIHNACV